MGTKDADRYEGTPRVIDITHLMRRDAAFERGDSEQGPLFAMVRQYDGPGEPDSAIAVPGRGRFGLVYTPADGKSRRETMGPVLPGPWAGAYGLAAVLSSTPGMSTGSEIRRNYDAGTEVDARIGDYLVIFGDVFTISAAPNRNINLSHVESYERE